MVEAPRIRILYENVRHITNKKIVKAYGSSYKKIGINLEGYFIKKWWYAGKYIYVWLTKPGSNDYVIRTHTMMYGKIIVVNQQTPSPKLKPFLVLELDDGTVLQWYLAQIKILDPNCSDDLVKSNYAECSSMESISHSMQMAVYDISNDAFNMDTLVAHIKNNYWKLEDDNMVDFLLNQEFFPGVGNILQQEALYRCRILPTKKVREITFDQIILLVNELSNVIKLLYQSYVNKKENKPHTPIFQIYHKAYCPLEHKTITKYLGKRNRRTTWCPICQK